MLVQQINPITTITIKHVTNVRAGNITIVEPAICAQVENITIMGAVTPAQPIKFIFTMANATNALRGLHTTIVMCVTDALRGLHTTTVMYAINVPVESITTTGVATNAQAPHPINTMMEPATNVRAGNITIVELATVAPSMKDIIIMAGVTDATAQGSITMEEPATNVQATKDITIITDVIAVHEGNITIAGPAIVAQALGSIIMEVGVTNAHADNIIIAGLVTGARAGNITTGEPATAVPSMKGIIIMAGVINVQDMFRTTTMEDATLARGGNIITGEVATVVRCIDDMNTMEDVIVAELSIFTMGNATVAIVTEDTIISDTVASVRVTDTGTITTVATVVRGGDNTNTTISAGSVREIIYAMVIDVSDVLAPLHTSVMEIVVQVPVELAVCLDIFARLPEPANI